MSKNSLIETGSFIALSTGFYFVAPISTFIIERIFGHPTLGSLSIILTNAVLAAGMLKLYFKFFPLLPKEVKEVEDDIELDNIKFLTILKKDPQKYTILLNEELRKLKKLKN